MISFKNLIFGRNFKGEIYEVEEVPDKDVGALDDYDSSSFILQIEPKPWYFVNGTQRPAPATVNNKTGKRIAKLLPFEDMENDRFANQMMFIPPNYGLILVSGKFKTILLYSMPIWWDITTGSQIFKNLKCPVDTCRLTTDRQERSTADMVFFHDQYEPTNEPRPLKQIYALYYVRTLYGIICLLVNLRLFLIVVMFL